MPLIEMRDFNVLIGNKTFIDQPLIIKQEAYKILSNCEEKMTIQQKNLLDYSYYQSYYKRIYTDLSR